MPDEPMTDNNDDRVDCDCLTPLERVALQGLVDGRHYPAGQDQTYSSPQAPAMPNP